MNIRTILSTIILTTFSFGCGYSSIDNELVAQPKRMHNETPIICGDRVDVDLSLGFMKDGVGSMSTHDTTMLVSNSKHRDILNEAIQTNKLVKVHYDERRIVFCGPEQIVTGVEIIK